MRARESHQAPRRERDKEIYVLKMIRLVFKATLFTLVILVASHLIRWNGRTVSDQVRSTLSSAEKSPALKTVKKKSKVIMNEAADAADRALHDRAERNSTEIREQDKAELQALIEKKGE